MGNFYNFVNSATNSISFKLLAASSISTFLVDFPLSINVFEMI